MKTIRNLNKWANRHNPLYLLDIARWFLGGFLFFKGVNFMTDAQYLKDLLAPEGGFLSSIVIYHYVTITHLGGGLLIIFGLLTRIAVAVQIPILIGAVAVNFLIAMHYPNLVEAGFALILSLFYMVVGSGKHSVDYWLEMQM